MSSETVIDIDTWLNEWEACLDMLINCGTDTPTDAVREAITEWQQYLPTQGFEALSQALIILQDQNSSRAERAQAFLDLTLWHRTMSQLHQPAQLSIN